MLSLKDLKGIGPKTILKLTKLNIAKPLDLLYHFPNHYLDFSRITTIAKAEPDSNVSLKLQIIDIKNIYTRGKNLQIATAKDASGFIKLLWLNQPYILKTLKHHPAVYVAGRVNLYQGTKTIFFPKLSFGLPKVIYPIYPETKGLTSNQLNKIITLNLSHLIPLTKDPLPASLKKTYNLADLDFCLTQVHRPQNSTNIKISQNRLATDELLSIHLQSLQAKADWLSKKSAFPITIDKPITNKLNKFIKSLSFKLTPDQLQTWQDIKNDLTSSKITNRLIQGDVGSGKTIIAFLSAFLNSLNNYSTVIIAPTQILANQHYQNLSKLLPSLPVYKLTSTSKTDLKKLPPNAVIVSTHSILHHFAKFPHQISLVIIDEQHKFGVDQRNQLLNSSDPPHLLTMTATPIPRSVKLTLLDNLDISSIHTMPLKRLKTKTYLVPANKQPNCLDWLKHELLTHQSQAYFVCPIIEKSSFLENVLSAQDSYRYLCHLFPDLKIGLLHGLSKDKDLIIKKFMDKKFHILVTTPIIEVGVDIKNANYMIVSNADRFGLSQLHQLRGRIGRGTHQAYCCLFSNTLNPKTQKRLNFIKNTTDCFKISRFDLSNRGPGTIFSTLQHGFPTLKLASLDNPAQNLLVRQIAADILENYPKTATQILKHSAPLPVIQN